MNSGRNHSTVSGGFSSVTIDDENSSNSKCSFFSSKTNMAIGFVLSFTFVILIGSFVLNSPGMDLSGASGSSTQNLAQLFHFSGISQNTGSDSTAQQPQELFPFPYSKHNHYPAASQTLSNAPEDNLHMTPICGHWQEEYILLHKSILEEHRTTGKENFMIFSSCQKGIDCGGFGDNLVGVLTTFMLAVLFRRAFLIEWNELAQTEALIPSTIDWRINSPNISLTTNIRGPVAGCDVGDPKDPTLMSAELNFINPGSEFGGAAKAFLSCLESLKKVGTVRLHTNRGLTHWTVESESRWGQQLREMGLRLPYISGCFLRFLFRLHPKLLQSVGRQVKELTNPSKLSVCIHSRYGIADAEYSDPNLDVTPYLKATEPLMKCATDLTDMWGGYSMGSVWYFMCGVPAVKKAIHEKYKDKIITTPILPGHTNMDPDRALAFEKTAVEWYLFSKCNFFIFQESGLSKTASMYSMMPMATFMFGRDAVEQGCNPLQPSDARSIGVSWSGL